MRINGVILPIGKPLHLTTISGDPAVLDMGDASVSANVFDSLSRYVAAVKPPLLIEHKVDGLQRGRVVEVYVGKNEDTGGQAICVGVELFDPELIEDANMIRRLSPYLLTDMQTVAGDVYPYALREVSIVSVPMIDEGQPDVRIAAASIVGLLRAESSYANLAKDEETSAISAQAGAEPMTAAEIVTAVLADAEAMAMLKAALMPEPAPAPVAEIVEPVPAAMPAPMMDPMAIAASARLTAIEAKLDRALAIGPNHAAVGGIAASARPVVGGVGSIAKPDPMARALAIQSEKGISFRDAHRLALQGA